MNYANEAVATGSVKDDEQLQKKHSDKRKPSNGWHHLKLITGTLTRLDFGEKKTAVTTEGGVASASSSKINFGPDNANKAAFTHSPGVRVCHEAA